MKVLPLLACCLAFNFISLAQPSCGDEIELKKLGDLPVRFNGRLATLEEVAHSFVLQFGKQDEFRDDAGNKYHSLDWYIHMIAGSKHSPHIRFLFTDDETAKQLGLKLNQTKHYSFEEIIPAVEEFSHKFKEIAAKEPSKRSPFEKELARLVRHLQTCMSLKRSHRSPWAMDKKELLEEVTDIDKYKGLHVPRMVIPNDRESGRWRILFPAAFYEFAVSEAGIGKDKFERSEYAKLLSDLLTSVANEKANEFETQLDSINKFLKKSPFDTNAFRFKPPSGWREEQTKDPYILSRYSDSMAMGIPMSFTSWKDGEQNAIITVNHFPGTKVSPITMLNSWRLLEGLPLLSEAEFKSEIKTGRMAGNDCWITDFSTPDFIPKKKQRTVSRILHHPSGTWVTSIYGDPKSVQKHLETFEKYVDSIVIPDQVEKWVGVEGKEIAAFENEVLWMILRRGKRICWLVRVNGKPKSVEKLRPEILKTVSSFVDLKPDGSVVEFAETTRWNKPDGWELWSDPLGNQQSYFIEDDKSIVLIELMVIEKLSDSKIVTLANHLRKTMLLEPIPAAKMRKQLKLDFVGETVEISIRSDDTQK